jgi:hypothetical protein
MDGFGLKIVLAKRIMAFPQGSPNILEILVAGGSM